MLNLLVTGGGGVGSESIYKQLNRKYNFYFADCAIENISDDIPKEKKILIPNAKQLGFKRKLIEICKKYKIDLVIPTVDEELMLWKKISMELPINILLPDSNFVERNLDKLKSSIFLLNNSIDAPSTYSLIQSRPPDKYIMKPRFGRGSRGIQIVSTDDEISAHLLLSKLTRDEFVIQEFIEGTEYTVTVVSDKNGNLKAIIPLEIELKKGITVRAKTVADADIIKYCSNIQALEKTPGVFNVQLIKSKDGRIVAFEINPRTSTTLCVAIASGIDVFEIFMNSSSSSKDKLLSYKENLSLIRNYINIIR